MEHYDTLSPLDYRYVTGALYEKTKAYLPERAAIAYLARVEAALAQTLADVHVCDKNVAKEIVDACAKVTAEDVYQEEARIKHNIRALVNCIRSHVSDKAKPFVHMSATSNDIVSTAEALRLKESVLDLVIPELLSLEKQLIVIADREKATVQIGRTHGQHAEPITVGFTFASYVSRLGTRIERLKKDAANIRGKFAGAVGAYNASSLLVKDPQDFEEKLLKKLSLKPASHATQLVEPEFALDVYHDLISAFGVLAQIADDMRHLQRSEINEVAEQFEKAQVGSSTMPHKRNPINFENIKSQWKAFVPRMTSVYLDQISEHQRDLTNSASARYHFEIVAALVASSTRLHNVLSHLVVDKNALAKNLATSMIAAEPAYILLAKAGHPNAHEVVRQLTQAAEQGEESFEDLLFANEDVRPYLNKLKKEEQALLKDPTQYIGLATQKTQDVIKEWNERLDL